MSAHFKNARALKGLGLRWHAPKTLSHNPEDSLKAFVRMLARRAAELDHAAACLQASSKPVE